MVFVNQSLPDGGWRTLALIAGQNVLLNRDLEPKDNPLAALLVPRGR